MKDDSAELLIPLMVSLGKTKQKQKQKESLSLTWICHGLVTKGIRGFAREAALLATAVHLVYFASTSSLLSYTHDDKGCLFKCCHRLQTLSQLRTTVAQTSSMELIYCQREQNVNSLQQVREQAFLHEYFLEKSQLAPGGRSF